jgi:serine/threonine protein kinase
MSIRVEPQAEPIPGYRLIERIGGGGFGEVWKAEAPGGMHKAIKFIHGDVDTIGGDSQRADQEYKALKRVITVRHPYILSLERFDIIDGRLLIVMELADRNLWDRFKECRAQGRDGIPRDELLRYMEETAEALDLMNTQYQLQHLDIKPQNLFLVYNHVKVADFGLVKDLQDRMAATITGGVTPVYAAPETFDGWVSRFCDQYSLAIVYQELLTGQRPFAGNTVHQLVMQHVQGKPNLAGLSPSEQAIIGRALSKDPDQRHPSCADLIKALRGQSDSSAASLPENGTGNGQADSPSPLQEMNVAGAPGDCVTDNGSIGDNATTVGPPGAASSQGSFWLRVKSAPEEPDDAVQDSSQLSQLPEVTGEGQLVPALIVGIGEMGLAALKQFRREIREHFGSLEALPHLRSLYVDTDPDGLANATNPGDGLALSRREVLVARLNRASYYLNPRQGKSKTEKWFDTAMLYRMHRNQVTGGVRALGRLAFFDNYKSIVSRLEGELEACTDPEALTVASQKTGLILRSNQPRIYVITSLAGGTGSGMFVDLAYVIRDQLRKMGYTHPDVTGLFVLPRAEPNQARAISLGNAYAALTELNHFSAPDVVFSSRYVEKEAPLTHTGPPFSRCVFLTTVPGSPQALDTAKIAGAYVCQELTTSLGRLIEASQSAPPAQNSDKEVVCQTFGMFRYSWPKRALMQEASRRFCGHLMRRWIAKSAKSPLDQIRRFVDAQWAENELGPEALIMRFRGACEQTVGREPETAFVTITAALIGNNRRLTEADRNAVLEAMSQLEEIVGQPVDSSVLVKAGVLEETLRNQGEALTAEWQQKLTRFTLDLIDGPEFRLAGAEEAIRQAGRIIEQLLTHHEPLCLELTDKATKGYERLHFLASNYLDLVKRRRSPQLLAELGELLQLYPKWRYQALVLRRVIYTYTSLRGFLSDQIREIGFYRLRLGELLSAFENPLSQPQEQRPVTSRFLFPVGCQTLEEAVDQLVPEATSEELEELDRRLQNLLRQQFVSLRHVCMTPSILMRNLELAMLAEAEAFVGTRLIRTNVVDTFFSLHPNEAEAQADLLQAFADAAPALNNSHSPGPTDLAVLAVPTGQEKPFRKLVAQVYPEAKVIGTAHLHDLTFYREEHRYSLGELKRLCTEASEAYQQMVAAEHFTPHSRLDISHWREA